MYAGWIFACFTGFMCPLFYFLLGDMLNSFGPQNEPEETLAETKKVCLKMALLSIIVWITGYLQMSLTQSASVKIGARIKQAYLEGILRQDCAWFDQVNY
jgi:hypothetical protein